MNYSVNDFRDELKYQSQDPLLYQLSYQPKFGQGYVDFPNAKEAGLIRCDFRVSRKSMFGNPFICLYGSDGKFLLNSQKFANGKYMEYPLSSSTEFEVCQSGVECRGKIQMDLDGSMSQIFKGDNTQNEVYGAQYIIAKGLPPGTAPRRINSGIPISESTSNNNASQSLWNLQTDGNMTEFLRQKNYSKFLHLINKTPILSKNDGRYILEYDDRSIVASRSNFILIDAKDEKQTILLQFGKTGNNEYILDFRYPLSPLQAFGLALSNFESKLSSPKIYGISKIYYIANGQPLSSEAWRSNDNNGSRSKDITNDNHMIINRSLSERNPREQLRGDWSDSDSEYDVVNDPYGSQSIDNNNPRRLIRRSTWEDGQSDHHYRNNNSHDYHYNNNNNNRKIINTRGGRWERDSSFSNNYNNSNMTDFDELNNNQSLDNTQRGGEWRTAAPKSPEKSPAPARSYYNDEDTTKTTTTTTNNRRYYGSSHSNSERDGDRDSLSHSQRSQSRRYLPENELLVDVNQVVGETPPSLRDRDYDDGCNIPRNAHSGPSSAIGNYNSRLSAERNVVSRRGSRLQYQLQKHEQQQEVVVDSPPSPNYQSNKSKNNSQKQQYAITAAQPVATTTTSPTNQSWAVNLTTICNTFPCKVPPLRSILTTIIPKHMAWVRCYIVRTKATLFGSPHYSMHSSEDDQYMMMSQKQKINKQMCYPISISKHALFHGGEYCLGKVVTSADGKSYQIINTDCNNNSNGTTDVKSGGGVITMAAKGLPPGEKPKYISIALPDHNATITATELNMNVQLQQKLHSKDYSNITHLWSQSATVNKAGQYTLSYNNREVIPSIKNIILQEGDENASNIVLQFGKRNDSQFYLDFQYPLSPVQAFAIALGNFDSMVESAKVKGVVANQSISQNKIIKTTSTTSWRKTQAQPLGIDSSESNGSSNSIEPSSMATNTGATFRPKDSYINNSSTNGNCITSSQWKNNNGSSESYKNNETFRGVVTDRQEENYFRNAKKYGNRENDVVEWDNNSDNYSDGF